MGFNLDDLATDWLDESLAGRVVHFITMAASPCDPNCMANGRGPGGVVTYEGNESHTVKMARDRRQKSIIASSFRTATSPMILPSPHSLPPAPWPVS